MPGKAEISSSFTPLSADGLIEINVRRANAIVRKHFGVDMF
jgi:hypothetical protein